MLKNPQMLCHRILIPLFLSLLCEVAWADQETSGALYDLKVDNQITPLGIDQQQPVFSWKMVLGPSGGDLEQSAYQLRVRDSQGSLMWDSGRVKEDRSVAIPYQGKKLQPESRYHWDLQIWDQLSQRFSKQSWFETALMDPDPDSERWQGAEWIGGGAESRVFYSDYLSVFKIGYQIQLDEATNTERGAFLLGGNDSRLMDPSKNLYQISSGLDQSYIKLELDTSPLSSDAEAPAQLHIYRVGYHPADSSKQPLHSIPIPLGMINRENRFALHQIWVYCDMSRFTVFFDGTDAEHRIAENVVVNPVGNNHDYISFPMVADIGFSVLAGQQASFSDVTVKHYREPSNTIFHENYVDGYEGIFKQALEQYPQAVTVKNGQITLAGQDTDLQFLADPSRNAMPLLRSEFTVADKKVQRARLYITARGIYSAAFNGAPIGKDVLTPGLSQYNLSHFYQTYDVTEQIQAGEDNTISAVLGQGWWSGNITFHPSLWNFFGDRQSLRAKLLIEFADGSRQVEVTSPQHWSVYNNGPLRYASLFQGEVYDATLEAEIAGWQQAGFQDEGWTQAESVTPDPIADFKTPLPWPEPTSTFPLDEMQLVSQQDPSPQIVKELQAVSVDEIRPGVYIYDMGQNMVGAPSLTIPDGVEGQRLTLRYAEVLYPEQSEKRDLRGMIMLENIRAALAQDLYILKDGPQVVAPSFTFHGYRYVEISGLKKPLPLAAVKGRVFSSIASLNSDFETSNPLVNKLWQNITWSMRGNFLSIPTDTPARNERMGWSGDINAFAPTATYLADVHLFLRRHLQALRDTQRADGRFANVAPLGGGFGGVLWGSAGITIPWLLYTRYGDVDALAEHYAAMQRYVDYVETLEDPETGRLDGGPLGDWLSPEGSRNDSSLFWAAYQLLDLDILAKSAAVLGKTQQANVYREKYDTRRKWFIETYIDADSGLTIAAGETSSLFFETLPLRKGSVIDTQGSYAVPLSLGLVDGPLAEKMAAHLNAAVQRKNTDDAGIERPGYSLFTGFIGTALISDALSANGYQETAFKLLQSKTYPSWLYPVENGATTIWERLNSYTHDGGFGGNNSMNSFNHYAFGAVGRWFYEWVLGFQPNEKYPAWKRFTLRPTVDPTGEMRSAKGYFDSPYGRIESAWQVEQDSVRYQWTIPANTHADLILTGARSEDLIWQRGESIPKQCTEDEGDLQCELPSGQYVVERTLP